MKKLIPNTLLEAFNFIALNGDVLNFQELTSTNRGKIVACDIYTQRNAFPDVITRISLGIGGQEVVGNMSSLAYDLEAYTDKYLLIPIKINDGQTFSLKADATSSVQDLRVSVIFLREGACSVYKRNSKLSTYILTHNFAVSTTSNVFEGTIPKSRGNCIGFSIIMEQIGGVSQDVDRTDVNFSVAGVEFVRNVPAAVFQLNSTRPYKKLFTPLESGSTYRFQVNTPSIDDEFYSIEFYFEKEIR